MSTNLTLEKILDDWFVLTITKQRYGGGLMGFITSNEEGACAMTDSLTGGDCDWESIYFPVVKSNWYPFATGETVEEVMNGLKKIIEKIPAEELSDFSTAVSYYSSSVMTVRAYQDLQPSFKEFVTFCENQP